MFNFTTIPANMDKNLYLKSLSREYKMPLETVFCVYRDSKTEEEFYSIIKWNKNKNAYGWKGKSKKK